MEQSIQEAMEGEESTNVEPNKGETFVIPTQEECVKAFSQQGPIFMKEIETCSKRQLVRILQALVVDGYNKQEFKFSYTHEKELFQLGSNVFNAKAFILHHGCNEHVKKQNETEVKSDGCN